MDYKLTKEQIKDIEVRTEGFKKKYVELTKEFSVDFLCYPQLVPVQGIPQQAGSFVTIAHMEIIDRKYAPIPSPIIQEK